MKRVWTLIKNDAWHQPKDVIIVLALVMPVLLALFVNLAFGNIFTDRAKLGIYDENGSAIIQNLQQNNSIIVKDYDNDAALRAATSSGKVDMGIVLPADFDINLQGNSVQLKAYIWGESLAKNRTLIPAALADAIHQTMGESAPVEIQTIALGEPPSLPWNNRLLPLVVLMAVFFGGMMTPASFLIHEKQRRTLEALFVTPTTLGQIFWAKGFLGGILALFMGVVTLAISGYGGGLLTLLPVLALGAVMAAEIGLLAGAYIKDMNTLYAIWKFGGVLLFGPAVVFMFPEIPQWLGYIFPTFYVVKPLVDISVSGASLGSEGLYLGVLLGLTVLGILALSGVVRKLSTQALRLNA
jgi:ABC-2 type transport system permease protein